MTMCPCAINSAKVARCQRRRAGQLHGQRAPALVDGYNIGDVGRPGRLVRVHELYKRLAIPEAQRRIVPALVTQGSGNLATGYPPSGRSGHVAGVQLDEIGQVE